MKAPCLCVAWRDSRRGFITPRATYLRVVDLPGSVLDAGVGALLSFGASAVAFRIALERRLGRLERDAEEHPAKETEERIRMLEKEMEVLEPLRDMIRRHGSEDVRRSFRGGRR